MKGHCRTPLWRADIDLSRNRSGIHRLRGHAKDNNRNVFFWSPRLHIDSVSNPPVAESIAVNEARWSSLLTRELVFTHGALVFALQCTFQGY